MPTKIALCALAALSVLFGACDGDRTAAFCDSVCQCLEDGEAQACASSCTQDIESFEAFNTGAPIVSDACFACVDHNTCQNIFAICSSECAVLIETLQNSSQPQPGDPIDTN